MKPKFRSILAIIPVASMMLLLSVLPAYAQRPEIKSFEPMQASYGHTVTIKGNSFGTNAANIVVRFGAAPATIIPPVTNQQIQEKVPSGATHDNISVTNISAGLTGYSRDQFFINFHGDGTGFSLANLQGQFDFPTTPAAAEGLNDLCMCDFDGDGRNDVGAAKNLRSIEYYLNTSPAPGTINFAKNSISVPYRLLFIQCGDLNGDGKPEIIATDNEISSKIMIYQNNSTPGTPSFSAIPIITIAPYTPTRIEVADLDLDGRSDLIFTASTSPAAVIILKNKGTGSAIDFSAPTVITLPLPSTSGSPPPSNGLAVQDLDGDDYPEIIAAPLSSGANPVIFLIKNRSTPGALSMTDITNISLGTGTSMFNLRVGDLDGDSKPDIAYTVSGPAKSVAVMLNQCTSSALAFSGSSTISTSTAFPYGLDMGDMDGDGKLDIVVAYNDAKTIEILKNGSSTGSVSFTSFLKTPTNSNNRHVAVGDVDNDGKPDIAFTSTDDVNLAVKASKIAILRNSACMKPEIDPPGPVNVCVGNTDFSLVATLGGGVTYQWTNTTTGVNTTTPSNEYTPTVDGNYFVTAISADCTPDPTSNTVVFTTSATSPYTTPTTTAPPACVGAALNLTTTDQGTGYTYKWTGPAGFTSSVREPQIAAATADNAGQYTVEIHAPSGCLLGTDDVTAVVRFAPSFAITNLPAENVSCGTSVPPKALTVSPIDPDYTYHWYRDGVTLNTTGSTFTMNGAGDYYFVATSNSGCADVTSTHYTHKLLSTPVPDFSITPPTACQGEEVTMNNESQGEPSEQLFYAWLISEDGRTSSEESPVFTFPNIATYNVKITVSYANRTCETSTSKQIIITGTGLAPLVITNPDNTYKICPEGELELRATPGFSSYEWSVDGETGESITISGAGEYTVRAEAPTGCIVTAKRTITEIQGLPVEANATRTRIDEGQETQLSVTNLLDYLWEPAETLNNPTIAQPTAKPSASTSYTVSGKDNNGCLRHASILIEVIGSSITNKLIPANFFSPNGDDQNQYWIVGLIDQYPQCNVTVYDDKGVKVFNSKPYQNNWDGTFNGKQLPPGVYYFIIRCDGEENHPRTGSITMMR